ncbi:bifunctional diguanylate cyclase/phosphodiesterase [Motiliproteus sp. SC1-56]|uniref:putative bifunctional diguanylate cyclase/phosphodiesterase n=1 Tax=Motiliproteus sp. SC1-56 TaxID=2799565 RepID=UPI001A8C872B|nr:EAL domain-containing protein [Motiliproteus sp. SC1-56]
MHGELSWLGTDYSSHVEEAHLQAVEQEDTFNLLIVDDMPRMAHSVQQLLDAYGFDSRIAEGGQEALDYLAQHRVDLMLLDLEMPRVSGFKVLEQIQQHFPDTDVIVVSGEASFDSATRVLRYGAQDFIRKPYSPDALVRAVRNVQQRREQRRQLKRMQQQLRSSEQRHRFIVNNSPDIIYMLDDQGRLTFVNERAETLLGYPRDELLGMHYAELVHEEDFNKALYAFAERRTGERASYNVEFRLKPKDRDLAPRYFESRTLTIELSAMGVYSSASDARRFVGTYGVARDISERKRAEELIQFQLHHDLLTKLPNRALFRDRLEQAMALAARHRSQLAVMYLDMDRFKVINDSLGHQTGDQLLQAVATRLRGCLRESDTLARVGGDEFTLLLPEIAQAADAEQVAGKILQAVEKPLLFEGIEIYVKFSIGIAVYPEDGTSLDTLIKHADTAMYHVKARGKNDFAFYRSEMRTLHSRQLQLESDLRRAVAEEQLRMYLQPQVDIRTRQVTGYEALVRWAHPQQGLLGPDRFIDVAEETGLINELGQWMVTTACQTLRRWADGGCEHLTLAVNVSARELMQVNFCEQILDNLERFGVAGHRLELEITENVLMQDMEQAVVKLKRLAQHGVRIAVDDFGTGYSSLSYLQSLPLHTLKIDRSFIHQIKRPGDTSAIVTAIVSMARGLGLDLVAEGVETQAQLEYLLDLDCSSAQGFLTGRPTPLEEIPVPNARAASG